MTLTPQQLSVCESAELTAWTSLWAAAPTALRDQLGLRCEWVGGAAAVAASEVPLWMFNRVLGLGWSTPATEDDVDTLLARYRESQVPYAVSLSPEAQPRDCRRWLERRGFELGNTWTKLIRSTHNPPQIASPLPVQAIGGAEAAARFGDLCVETFELPPRVGALMASAVGRDGWRVYVAVDGDRAVAGGALCVARGVGWLGIGSVRAEYRGRGLHRALIARRVADAAALGCRHVVVETRHVDPPNASQTNLRRLGFGVAYQRPNYVIVARPTAGARGVA